MALAPGTALGPYEIVGLVGAGGMGEVYRARDTRLGRTVALKLTAGSAGDDPQQRLRLEREARAIAALNHPNICAIHDVGRHDGRDYIVMEYVDGETLERRLQRGPLPWSELARVAMEMSSALVAAHREGITHRDLKPSNVMLTRAGVKLLDFGIARHQAVAHGSEPLSEDQITTQLATVEGTLAGTLPYMAPEQLEGRAVDRRTDIFGFGAVLFEMATGRRAFAGTSAAGLVAAILAESRPRLPEDAGLPRALGRITSACLARDPDERWQDAADLQRALKWAAEDSTGAQDVVKARSRRWVVHAAWAAALVATGALLWSTGGPARAIAPPPNPQPVIVLMDSPLPGRVYDPRTLAAGGTNADDVTDALRDLPVSIRKENTSAVWHREAQVIGENPDLIVSHLSCLLDARVANDQRAVFDHLLEVAENRLLMFFAYVAAGNPRAQFVVYSRGVIEDKGGEAAWAGSWEARLPVLRGRLHAFSMPGGMDKATFRDPATAQLLKARVMHVLKLDGR
jgi:hypothetical protein